MITMEPKIGMISSSLNLAELTRRVAKRMGVQIEVQIGALERVIENGKEMEAKGIEVIISRGGTAAVLRGNLSIPVLSLPMSAFDLLENVVEASKYGRKIGISIYGNPISGIEILERFFQIEIKQIIYHNSESLRIGIQQAKNEGLEVLIGGNFSFEVSQEIGLPCVLISSSEETIGGIIEEANVVATIRREEKKKTRRMEAILNSVSEGIVAIDKGAKVMVFNKAAEDILGIRGALGLSINTVVPQLGLCDVLKIGVPKFQCLQKVGEAQILTTQVPIYLGEEIIGAIASFTDITKVIRAEQKVRRSYTKGFVAKYTVSSIVCESQAMKGVIEQVRNFAQSDSTVLIIGESGTGKELVSHSIHNLSPRSKEPFVTINCSALAENLLESELFGHEEGAFTGAKRGGKIGLFELAHKGTIFLDEIGSISKGLQARFLRVLEQKDVMRIGGDRIIPVDVRIIAATNKGLLTEVKEGRMRLDLYFRLNILKIHIPPLRERKEDIPYFVRNFMDFFAGKYNKRLEPFSQRLLERFIEYSWPGNVRELENLIERFVLMTQKPDQNEEILNTLFEECSKTENVLIRDIDVVFPSSESSMKKILTEAPAKKAEIAKRLGVSRTTLWRRSKNMESTHN
ncbi:MAG: sigma 54-interacting transcriptional regulator [Thermodesulfobacteriota bacterium]|nr:sigma 54-interacting transcriptional regulator [Thermodesulfobacteriota bacterium]